MKYTPSASTMQNLFAFKAEEREDDPTRVPDIRGPYEIMYYIKHGGYPPGSWNLRVPESRSGVLFQALSGALDKYPPFMTAYMALAIDKSLGDDEYVRELKRLNKSWANFLDRNGLATDHHHHAMKAMFGTVSCLQCNELAMLTCHDPGIHELVEKEILPLKTLDERKAFLKERGLLPYLYATLPDVPAADPKPER